MARVDIVAALGTIALAGCQNAPQLQAIDVPAISAVQGEIDRQVAIYKAAQREPPLINVAGVLTPVTQLRAPDGGPIFACGSGDISFDISTSRIDNNADKFNGLFGRLVRFTQVYLYVVPGLAAYVGSSVWRPFRGLSRLMMSQ